jgi:beta-galactosidase/beta-glucuronidase
VLLRDGDRTVDAHDVLFGFRSFSLVTPGNLRPGLSEGMFLLNGQPIFLRGTNVSPSLNAFW